MVIPWVGFPLAHLIKRCEPTSKTRFVEFATLHDIGQRQDSLRRAAAANVVDDHWPQAYGFYSNVNRLYAGMDLRRNY